MSDATYYHHAPTADAKASVEIAVAQEKLQTMVMGGGCKVVRKQGGDVLALAARTATAALPTKEEHVALWHVLHGDGDGDRGEVKVVYVYAHVVEKKDMEALVDVLGVEMKGLEGEGRLRGERGFGVAQAGMGSAFFEYGGAGGLVGRGGLFWVGIGGFWGKDGEEWTGV